MLTLVLSLLTWKDGTKRTLSGTLAAVLFTWDNQSTAWWFPSERVHSSATKVALPQTSTRCSKASLQRRQNNEANAYERDSQGT